VNAPVLGRTANRAAFFIHLDSTRARDHARVNDAHAAFVGDPGG
jgi:hypothetical protein